MPLVVGIKNQEDFCLKVTSLKDILLIFKWSNEEMTKMGKFGFSNQFYNVKNFLEFLELIFKNAGLVTTLPKNKLICLKNLGA